MSSTNLPGGFEFLAKENHEMSAIYVQRVRSYSLVMVAWSGIRLGLGTSWSVAC
jgi:hypothetical protein